MKRSLLLLPLFLLPAFWLMSTSPTGLKVNFSQSDWDESKAKARTSEKLFYVEFDASYCAICRNMDQSTYMDTRLADFMSQNVVALRVDVQDFDGVMWSQQYEVDALPTMLVFNEKGELVKRLVGYKSANDLLSTFKEVLGLRLNPAQDDNPLPLPNTNKGDNKTQPQPAPQPAPTPSFSGKLLYELQVRKPQEEGFTLQVGAFSSYETLLEQAEKLQGNYPNQRMLMQVAEAEGRIIYRILLGVFESRGQATEFRSQIQKQGLEGTVRDLRTINL